MNLVVFLPLSAMLVRRLSCEVAASVLTSAFSLLLTHIGDFPILPLLSEEPGPGVWISALLLKIFFSRTAALSRNHNLFKKRHADSFSSFNPDCRKTGNHHQSIHFLLFLNRGEICGILIMKKLTV
jgi:hypothetical protein